MKLEQLNATELLEKRFCDLSIKIKGTWLQDCVKDIYSELKSKSIHFKPEFYLADEWLTPEGEPVVGIAFYLADPVLMKLEKKMVHEVEGGNKPDCMKLLRHEVGHTINYAYILHRRKKWRELFGPFNADYPDKYKYRPYSKSYVRHLDDFYAQYHPDEDFAETFAVWLTPDSNWKEVYKDWKALEKLEYVDKIMKEISVKPAKVKSGRKYWSIDKMKTTLKTYYKRKKEQYLDNMPDFHDSTLNRLFPQEDNTARVFVNKVLTKYKKEIVDNIALLTGEKKHIIRELLKNMIKRCRELNVKSVYKEGQIIHLVTAYLTTLTMNYYYTAGYKKRK